MITKKTIFSFLFIGLFGVLGHFLYEWTGNNAIIGMFFPVNESTWEHLKLLFFPTLIYSLGEYFLCKEKPQNYFPAIAISVFCGMLSIVVLFYTISGILGFNVDFVNILIYFIGVAVTVYKKNKLLKNEKFSSQNSNIISLMFIILLTVLFVFWSFNPPSLGVFTPPISN